jgi:hypothetical protein
MGRLKTRKRDQQVELPEPRISLHINVAYLYNNRTFIVPSLKLIAILSLNIETYTLHITPSSSLAGACTKRYAGLYSSGEPYIYSVR